MIKVGILGAGWAATEHADAFEQMDDVAVTAVWNRTRERSELFPVRAFRTKWPFL